MTQNPFEGLGGGGGGFDMNALLQQAQQMQEQLASAQERLADATADGTVAGIGVNFEVKLAETFAVDFEDRLAFVVIDERQPLCPADVEEVVVGRFGGRPRRVLTGPALILRCMKSSRSARRCACSARVTLSSSSLIRWCNPVASGLESPSDPGAIASSIALSALVSSR